MIRAAKTTPRPGEGIQSARDVPVVQVVRALNTEKPVAGTRPSPDWAGVREGVSEVFLTVAATLAIGITWAAIETGRIDPGPARAGASEIENRYDGEPRAGR